MSKKFDIAAIFLSYDNKRLLGLLKQRGNHLVKANLKRAIKVDSKITQLSKDPEYQKRMVRPVVAFVTFNDQEDQALFLELFETEKTFFQKTVEIKKKVINGVEMEGWKQFNLCGHNAACTFATEPTSIYWDHLQNTF